MILFRRFEYITKRGYATREPEQVSRATNVYRNVNYITEKIIDDRSLTIQDIYSEFKEWYKSSYSTLYNMPSKTERKEYMEK